MHVRAALKVGAVAHRAPIHAPRVQRGAWVGELGTGVARRLAAVAEARRAQDHRVVARVAERVEERVRGRRFGGERRRTQHRSEAQHRIEMGQTDVVSHLVRDGNFPCSACGTPPQWLITTTVSIPVCSP